MAKGPVKKIKVGGIYVNVWEKENTEHPDWGAITSYQIEKNYKKKDGTWAQQSVWLNNISECVALFVGLQQLFEYKYLPDPKLEGVPDVDTSFLD